MEQGIPVILCELECIFPPGFFNVMEHLPVHLAREALLGGPVQYRSMYPFERFLGKLKKMVNNKACVEGSICEAYLHMETTYFCSYYFESSLPSMRTRCRRNEYELHNEETQSTLSIFELQGRLAGKEKKRYLNDQEYKAAHLHILLNCAEVEPYIEFFKQQKREACSFISNEALDGMIANEFISWFKDNVKELQLGDVECYPYLCQVAMGPLRVVSTYPIFYANGYKLHTHEWSEGKKTMNCGVCVTGTREGDYENEYYGILKEVIQLEYPGEPL